MNSGSFSIYPATKLNWGFLSYYSTHLTGFKTRPVLLRFVWFPCLLMMISFSHQSGLALFELSTCPCVVRDRMFLISLGLLGQFSICLPVACSSMCACHIVNIA